MSKFKVGDKVIITKTYESMTLVGARATIMCIEGSFYGLDIEGWKRGHRLGGMVDNQESGWWVTGECIKLVRVFKGNLHAC